ncbi:MAG: hypothetical protein ACP5HM_00985 [Anaerolineae bacterium]
MTLLDRIKENMYGLERGIAEVVPGYKGYKQKELRREADKLLRDTLVSRLRTVKRQLDVLQQDLISAGKIDLLDVVGSATTQLQTFIDRIRTASYGYGGLFSAVRVKEEDLERVYQFDAQLLDYVDRIESAVGRAREAVESEEASAQVLILRDLGREANDTFDRRQEIINGSDAV